MQKALVEIGCTVEDDDAKGGSYKADDVQCKHGQYDMTLDKDFKITQEERLNHGAAFLRP